MDPPAQGKLKSYYPPPGSKELWAWKAALWWPTSSQECIVQPYRQEALWTPPCFLPQRGPGLPSFCPYHPSCEKSIGATGGKARALVQTCETLGILEIAWEIISLQLSGKGRKWQLTRLLTQSKKWYLIGLKRGKEKAKSIVQVHFGMSCGALDL